MGEFVMGVMKQFVQQATNTINLPTTTAPQIKQEAESDCEIIDDSSMHTAIGMPPLLRGPGDMNSGEIVSSTPEERSEGELIIDVDPAYVIDPELLARDAKG